MNMLLNKKEIPEHLLKFFKPVGQLNSGNDAMVPARLALALQADGWIVRSELPWCKRSPMPESCTNRPAKSLESVFMLVKRQGYYSDFEAVKKVQSTPAEAIIARVESARRSQIEANRVRAADDTRVATTGRIIGQETTCEAYASGFRNFWQADLWFESVDKPHGLTGITIDGEDELVGLDATSQGYKGAHFATYPPGLIRPLIQAGTSERGACPGCGAPWVRVTGRRVLRRERPNQYVKRTGEEGTGNTCANDVAGVESRTLGWRPGCGCYGLELIGAQPREPVKNAKEVGMVVCPSTPPVPAASSGAREDLVDYEAKHAAWVVAYERWIADWERLQPLYDACAIVPCTMLDPFLGSGTTSVVSLRLGRRSVGIELSEAYIRENAVPRIEGCLLDLRRTELLPRRKGETGVRGRVVERPRGKSENCP